MRWREHLYDMDYLREGIGLRGLAQIDPLIAYKNEGFELFQDLMNTIWSDFARMVFNVEVEIEDDGEPETAVPDPAEARALQLGRRRRAHLLERLARRRPRSARSPAATPAPRRSASPKPPEPQRRRRRRDVAQRRVDAVDQIGRNDPCWCGSGKKFKKCHGA